MHPVTRLAVPCFELIEDTDSGRWLVVEAFHSSDGHASDHRVRVWSFPAETRARQRLGAARRAHHEKHGCDPLHPYP